MEKEEARVKAAHVRDEGVRRAQEDISIVCCDTGATTPKDKAEGTSKNNQHSKGARLAIGNLPGMVVPTARLASFASLRSFACGMFVLTVNDFQKR
jgi:hypothetical protein